MKRRLIGLAMIWAALTLMLIPFMLGGGTPRLGFAVASMAAALGSTLLILVVLLLVYGLWFIAGGP